MKKNNQITIISLVVAIIVLGGAVAFSKSQKTDSSDGNADKIKAVVYKSPTCGCCVQYVAYLKKQGFEVETVSTDDMASIKDQHGIKGNMESCHTTIIGDYFIEGHIPMEAVSKLLTEKPEIDGIALPEMPAGSPGMPGIKAGAFEIYGIKGGESSDFMSL